MHREVVPSENRVGMVADRLTGLASAGLFISSTLETIMDKNVPAGAALLLDFIGDIEAPRGYDTIYGNNQAKLAKPLTTMTLDEVIAAGPGWTKAYGSSAAGRYQFMNATLKDLKKELGLRGTQILGANLQDRLAYHLLKRRGYDDFMAGTIGAIRFAGLLAREWASLPVLVNGAGAHRSVVRGQSYYAGDGLNKSLVKPEAVEALLAKVRAGPAIPATPQAPPASAPPLPTPDVLADGPPPWIVGIIVLAIILVASAAFFFDR